MHVLYSKCMACAAESVVNNTEITFKKTAYQTAIFLKITTQLFYHPASILSKQEMLVKHCYFYRTVWPFVKLYNIELGDQEFFTQFISIDILWSHRLHIVPLWRKQSIALAFLCGPSVFCSTGSVFATHGRILFLCSTRVGVRAVHTAL